MRYSKYRKEDEKPKQTNPIWRGIGCLLALIAPIVAFAIANLAFTNGVVQQYINLPVELRRNVTLPFTGAVIPYFYGTLALTGAIVVALFAVVFTVYSAVYRVVGPSRYGPTDVAPVRSRRRVRKSR
jgi:hypothetical protein